MVQMKAMIQNLISEIILYLPARTINEKDIKNLTFYSPEVPSYLLVLLECIKQYDQFTW